jgi:hypothetical protein
MASSGEGGVDHLSPRWRNTEGRAHPHFNHDMEGSSIHDKLLRTSSTGHNLWMSFLATLYPQLG